MALSRRSNRNRIVLRSMTQSRQFTVFSNSSSSRLASRRITALFAQLLSKKIQVPPEVPPRRTPPTHAHMPPAASGGGSRGESSARPAAAPTTPAPGRGLPSGSPRRARFPRPTRALLPAPRHAPRPAPPRAPPPPRAHAHAARPPPRADASIPCAPLPELRRNSASTSLSD